MDDLHMRWDMFSGNASEGERNIACPFCGNDYTHIRGVGTLLGSDAYEARIYPGAIRRGRTGARRSALCITFDCETGCAFHLVIQQHKGINYIEVGKAEPAPKSSNSFEPTKY